MATAELTNPLRRLIRRVLGSPRASIVMIAAVVTVAALVAVGGGGEGPPAIGAASIVPSDALAYFHVSLDGSRPAVKRGLSVASRFPDYPLARLKVISRLGGLGGGTAASVDYERQIRPWLGKEAAIALLNTASPSAGSLIVIDVVNRTAAERFITRFGQPERTNYRSTQILAFGQGSQAAFVGHYLAIGQEASVRAAIDVASRAGSSLEANSSYTRAIAGDPPGRVLDVYLSVDGIRRLLSPQAGVVGALGALLYQPALLGASITITPVAGGVRVRVHSALDSQRARGSGERRAMYSPTLIDAVPAGAELALDTNELDQVAPQLFGAGQASGVLGRVGPLLRRLGTALRAQGFGTQLQQVLSVFRGETVVSITRAGRKGSASPGRPTLVIVARAQNQDQTRSAFADLQGPLARLFQPADRGPGQAPVFYDRQVAGITAHQLVLGPGLEFDYAVFDGKVVLSTSLAGIAGVRNPKGSLTADPGYRVTLGDRPERLTSLVFLDFSQLLSLGESTGLTRSARYRALRADLQRIRAVGLNSTSGEADSTAELFLQIS